MKKITIAFAALAAAFTVSCNKEAALEEPVTSSEFKEVVINASYGEQTKTSYGESGEFSWTKGDKVSVLGSDNQFYTLTATSAGAVTTFAGTIPAGVELGEHALYPASENHTYDAAKNKLSFYIEKSKDLSKTGSADLPMTAKKNAETGSYAFKHLGGGFLFSFADVPAEYSAVVVKFQNSKRLSGSLSTRWSSSGGCWISMGSDGSGDQNVYERKVAVSKGGAEVYLPYSYEYALSGETTVTVSGDNGSGNPVALIVKKIDLGSITHTRGKVYRVPSLSLKAGSDPSAVIPETIEVSGLGGDVLTALALDGNWSVKYSSDWFTAEKVGKNLKVSASSNSKFVPRSGELKIVHGGKEYVVAVSQDTNFELSGSSELLEDGTVKVSGTNKGKVYINNALRHFSARINVKEIYFGEKGEFWFFSTEVGDFGNWMTWGQMRLRDKVASGKSEYYDGGNRGYDAGLTLEYLNTMKTYEFIFAEEEFIFMLNDEKVYSMEISCPFSDERPDMGGWFFGFYNTTSDGSYYIIDSCEITPIAE